MWEFLVEGQLQDPEAECLLILRLVKFGELQGNVQLHQIVAHFRLEFLRQTILLPEILACFIDELQLENL